MHLRSFSDSARAAPVSSASTALFNAPYFPLSPVQAHLAWVLAYARRRDEIAASRSFEVIAARWLRRPACDLRWALLSGMTLANLLELLPRSEGASAIAAGLNGNASREWHPEMHDIVTALRFLGVAQPILRELEECENEPVGVSQTPLSDRLSAVIEKDATSAARRHLAAAASAASPSPSAFSANAIARTLWLIAISTLTRPVPWSRAAHLALFRCAHALLLDPLVIDTELAAAVQALISALLRESERVSNQEFAALVASRSAANGSAGANGSVTTGAQSSSASDMQALAASFERTAFSPLLNAMFCGVTHDSGSVLRWLLWWPAQQSSPFVRRATCYVATAAVRFCLESKSSTSHSEYGAGGDMSHSAQAAASADSTGDHAVRRAVTDTIDQLFGRPPSLASALAFILQPSRSSSSSSSSSSSAADDIATEDGRESVDMTGEDEGSSATAARAHAASGRCALTLPASTARIAQLTKTAQLLMLIAGDMRADPAAAKRLLQLAKDMCRQTSVVDAMCAPVCLMFVFLF